jgi:hypothetical protein
MKYSILITCVFTLCYCSPSSKNKIGHPVAVAHGIDNFNKVKMIEFTFNVQRDTAKPSSRHWQWFPKTNEAVFLTDTGNTRFKRTDTTTQELKQLNARFTNDEYWLIYPFHLSWDKGFNLVDSGMKASPISGKNLRKITARYNNKDGFTPGDMYDVYVDEGNMVREWVYHRKASAEPTLMTSWEDYQDFEGLKIAKDHRSKDGKFRLYFTDVRVEK